MFDDDVVEYDFDGERICEPNVPWVDDDTMPNNRYFSDVVIPLSKYFKNLWLYPTIETKESEAATLTTDIEEFYKEAMKSSGRWNEPPESEGDAE